MKNIQYIKYSFVILSLLVMSACKRENFLDKFPQTSISEQNYFKTDNDLQYYVNQFYAGLGYQNGYDDGDSDTQVPRDVNSLLAGTYTIPAVAGGDNWDWSTIRAINFFIVRAPTSGASQAAKDTYMAEAKFFRAFGYFNQVKRYGDIPWSSKDLKDDSPELYEPRASRKLVMDSVLNDLDYAIENLKDPANTPTGRINKMVALALKSRICLWEGTFRKYHALGDESKFLTAAVDAASKIINSGTYKIYSTGDPKNDYRNVFLQESLIGNSENILAIEFILNVVANSYTRTVSGNGYGFSKSFIKTYLSKDGLPISKSTLYKGDDTYDNELTDRDPRLTQTIPARDYLMSTEGPDVFSIPRIGTSATSTGYQIIKYRSSEATQFNANQNTTDHFIFRYAEILLNYAEAKAELGQLTQEDIDMSIGKIRARAGMPNMVLASLQADSETLYPTISVILQEIRRERGVELAGEGFRFDDILRWKAGALINNPESIVGLKLTDAMKAQYNSDQISSIILDGNNRIRVYPNITQRVWDDKNYYFPIPLDQLTLNTKLTQSPGW